MSALKQELIKQIEQLDFLLTGDRKAYKSISVALRLLLLGSSGDKPLVTQAYPDFTLPPLNTSNIGEGSISIPANYSIVSGEARVMFGPGVTVGNINALQPTIELQESMLDASGSRLALKEWLDQEFLTKGWTIEKTIRLIAHKDGGAHLDLDDQNLKMFATQWLSLHEHIIVWLARDVRDELKKWIAND